MTPPVSPPRFRRLGVRAFEPVWREMQQFTAERDETTHDEIWLLQHPPVFTLGLNATKEHILAPGDIPVVAIDRGGQVTYHGPGQLVVYPLIELKRLGLGVRDLVSALERAVVATVADWGIKAAPRTDAPGVYVDGCKLASLGLRIRRGCSYHGLAFNVEMDLEPFQRINPCGFPELEMTQLANHGGPTDVEVVADAMIPHLLKHLGYNARSDIGAVHE